MSITISTTYNLRYLQHHVSQLVNLHVGYLVNLHDLTISWCHLITKCQGLLYIGIINRIELSWYHHQPESRQQSFKKVSE